MLYDEGWKEKQDAGFATWINYTLFPPEQEGLEGASEEAAQDGAHFRQLQQKRHLFATRRKALAFYRSAEMQQLRFVVEQEVMEGNLSVRQDRDMYSDLVRWNLSSAG